MVEYEIGGRKYFLKPLVLGQAQQLIRFLKGKKLPESLSPIEIIESLGDDLSEGLAIVLSEEGKHLKDKNLKELAKEIQFSILPESVLEIIKDFFELNPLASILQRLAEKINQIIDQLMTGSMKSSSPSQEETSQKETKSSGDTP